VYEVKVPPGVTDADYPDLPHGARAGTAAEIDECRTCLVRWSKDTLAKIHPVHRKRSERDGLDRTEMWLGEDDLEPDQVRKIGG